MNPPRFDVNDPAQRAGFLAYLDEHGYAVSANVAETADLPELRSLMWDFLETFPPYSGVSREDPDSWGTQAWLPHPDTGIITEFGFGQSEFIWKLRLLPRVKQTFAAIWENDNDLLVSFDGGNAFRPWKRNGSWLTEAGWWHLDQNAVRGAHRRGKVRRRNVFVVCFRCFVIALAQTDVCRPAGVCVYT